jgi:hypothetical protein
VANRGVGDKPRVSERSEDRGCLPGPKTYSCQMEERGKILCPGTYLPQHEPGEKRMKLRLLQECNRHSERHVQHYFTETNPAKSNGLRPN